MEARTDIVIVLYGDRKDLDRCVASVEKHCTEYALHVVDNNEVNRGFTKGNNEGIVAGTAPWVWLLNQDAVVLEGAQQALIDRFSYGPKVGIVGSMQIDYDNQDLIRHGGTSRAFPAGAHKGGLLSMGHCSMPEKQTWVNFASVMLRREMIEKIGPLDERMYLVYSDSDYCYHAREQGWECWYAPRSRVLHRLNVSKKVTDWHRKDMQAFMDKWGIKALPDGQFAVSERFSRLDMFP